MKEAVVEQHTIKDEILDFVLNSSEETNSKVAIFIAGMRAQKNLTDYRQEAGKGICIASQDVLTGVKIGSAGK